MCESPEKKLEIMCQKRENGKSSALYVLGWHLTAAAAAPGRRGKSGHVPKQQENKQQQKKVKKQCKPIFLEIRWALVFGPKSEYWSEEHLFEVQKYDGDEYGWMKSDAKQKSSKIRQEYIVKTVNS